MNARGRRLPHPALLFFVPLFNYSSELRNSSFRAQGDGRFKKKRGKREEKGQFFLFCAPLPLTTEVKIGGGAGKLILRRLKTKKNWQQQRDFSAAHISTNTSISLIPLLSTSSGAIGLYTEFNAEQLLFEAFSHIMRIFGSVEPQTESTFPFHYNIIFETYQFLEPLSSTLEGGKMCTI